MAMASNWHGRVKNALADRYGQGHFSTRATHEERWNQFARYLKERGINDTRKINQTVLNQYSHYLKNAGEQRSSQRGLCPKPIINRQCGIGNHA